MKHKQLKYPYQQYVGYRQFLPSGRCYVYMWNRKTDKRRLISMARYKLAVHLGRKLDKTEEADHKDGDFTNDRISNLQVLSGADNKRKMVKQTGKSAVYITIRCKNCGVAFERSTRIDRQRTKEGRPPACSRSCGATLAHKRFK